ncbi:hypothetical protein [Microbulbifer sp. THAF38]|uniref:hypothetical protein n=1 Tax=Microbulbifer sp. THAF38 TaxID=2587856 RepID=UPI00126792EF|nr:hypothetical protein [Microbulbifer sp. THAF38]QFT57090.1 hypothetical protein FIU95_21295 [Microbulbifer sp. THAF38]
MINLRKYLKTLYLKDVFYTSILAIIVTGLARYVSGREVMRDYFELVLLISIAMVSFLAVIAKRRLGEL